MAKELKPYRSHAERTRVRQGWILITLATLNVTLGLLIFATSAKAQPTLDAHARSRCHTHACVERVKRKALAREMRRYHRHPMPYCTWGPESSWDPATGRSYAGRPWARGRYRVVNPSSKAGGKFQFLRSTWTNIGGWRYARYPQDAKPVYQERMARKLMRRAGLVGTWSNC